MMRLVRWVRSAGRGFNAVSCLAIIVMMVLTCADVILRLFGRPILGTYEMIGFLGSVVVSFSLAYTSLEKGHVSVEIFVERLPERLQLLIDAVGALIGSILFAVVAWQSAVYALDLKHSGEVSMTLQMPVYPFLLGMAAGCGMLCLVLISEMLRSTRRMVQR
ncbi:MAG: TRAP transporter small permease [Deltaproteobacteria bacterium]|nr:TRAP transporter small permease [Deltaproteobacteria bacterium]